MIKDFLNGGKALRREAATSIESAVARLDAMRVQSVESTRCAAEKIEWVNAANERAHKVLPPNHERLYQLAELNDVESPAPSIAALPSPLEIRLDQLPSIPSLAACAGAGGAAALAAGGAIAVGAALSGPVLALLLVPVLIGVLCGALVQGRRALKVGERYQDFANATRVQADQHAHAMERLGRCADLHLTLTAHLEKQALDKQSALQTVAADTTIAAMLLRDVLNTPLLNEEGAFIQEVVDQLHDQRKRVAKFKDHVDMVAG
ncbi:hypothetical protein GTP81_09835 [Rugamonas sp. FT107W]|uniref:Uncharacterized protein n=1 Tax=Duganella vulcania TaxID=2692166 RepID=A0A845HE62_9BURK|nr:hypothetical protein [Duganella vulcania]MYN17051.1 hypothetical protein [Duganella vulcania]